MSDFDEEEFAEIPFQTSNQNISNENLISSDLEQGIPMNQTDVPKKKKWWDISRLIGLKTVFLILYLISILILIQ